MSVDLIYRVAGMVFFGIAGVFIGTFVGPIIDQDPAFMAQVFGLVGLLVGLILTPWITIRPIRAFRGLLAQLSMRTLVAGLLGLILSLIIAGLLSFPLSLLPEPFSQVLPIIAAALLSYFGVAVFISRQAEIFSMFNFLPQRISQAAPQEAGERSILVDTSVIIDGRITDIAATGFLSGSLLIPRFVLNELQHVADSSDKLRRQRGRRGLEVVSKLKENARLPVRISDVDVEDVREVDEKLVVLARQLKVPILTNDFNLNRVAELQGVSILNVNDLANAVKVVVLPGEELVIRVIQEGREANQGVGYLDDGTMVVVQDGSKFVGQEVETSVTKVLQTAAGKMIFAKPERTSGNGKRNNSKKKRGKPKQ